jgi:hypothetical protein
VQEPLMNFIFPDKKLIYAVYIYLFYIKRNEVYVMTEIKTQNEKQKQYFEVLFLCRIALYYHS